MSELYNLILFPVFKPDADESEVKASLASRLKIDIGKVEGWFASDTPTLLLKSVESDVAGRYMKAIAACGGTCNMQPAGSDGKNSLSLVPKPANVELFICPSCEYEEELTPGVVFEQCPECNLVLAKWAEKQEEDRKKAEIRRRLLRDARYKDDTASAEQKRKAELAELKRLEAELMKEMGIKPPSKMWQIFSQRPVSISLSIGILLIGLSSAISFYVSDYFAAEEEAALADAPASPEIQQLAPAMVDAVGLQLTGNQEVVAELAKATQLLANPQMDTEALMGATQQMMKGVGNDEFIEQANAGGDLKKMTPGGLGEPAPVSVNRDSLGGVVGLPGVSTLADEQIATMGAGDTVDSLERVASVLNRKLQLPDLTNPNGPDIMVDQIDRMDGSDVVSLVKSLSIDLEWDNFLLSQVKVFLAEGRSDQAEQLNLIIENPTVKTDATVARIEYAAKRDPNQDFKVILAGLAVSLNDVKNPDLRAKYWLDMAQVLGDANVRNQRSRIVSRVRAIAADAENAADEAAVLARLAIAELRNADVGGARKLFRQAMEAGAEGDTATRIRAFSQISNRYYDARNLTLAGEILSEAQVLAATELTLTDRVPVLMDIARAQLYQGDMDGALLSLSNAARGEAREKLLSQLAIFLIDEGDIYGAQALMERLEGSEREHRLAIRLIGRIVNLHSERKALALLKEYSDERRSIRNPVEEALVLSQFARLHLRLQQNTRGIRLFNEALQISDQLLGRKADITRSMIGLDQARGLLPGRALDTIARVNDTLISEPISSEVSDTIHSIRNVLPKAIREIAEAER